jgi:hypothetical protein
MRRLLLNLCGSRGDLFAPWVEGRWLQLPQLLQLGTTQQLELDELWVFEQFAIRACRAGAFCWG